MQDIVRMPNTKYGKLMVLSAAASVGLCFVDFPLSGLISGVLAVGPLYCLASKLQHAKEQVTLNHALERIDVIRDGVRLTGNDAIVATISRQGEVDGVLFYRALLRTVSRDWFLIELNRTPSSRAQVNSVSIISEKEALEAMEDDPERHIFWSDQIAREARDDEARTCVDAKPLKLITIQAQGTEYTPHDSLIRALESALAQLRAGRLVGEESDDDYGYRFEVSTHQDGSIFPAPASKH